MNKHLDQLGWTEQLQNELESIANPKLSPARVVRENRGQYIASTGDSPFAAQLSGAFHARVASGRELPTVGDWIALDRESSHERGIIHALLPRKSLIERQVAGNESRSQLIAANVDTLFLVSGLDGEFNINRIQR